MKQIYDFFQIKNKDYYQMNKESIDCHSCQNIILDPKICKKCGFLFCNKCLRKNKCPMCLISSTTDILLSNKTFLDKVKLICKLGCEVPLSKAYLHMSSCPKLKMNECWNCNQKALPKSIKISKDLKNTVDDDQHYLKNKRLRENNLSNSNYLNDLNVKLSTKKKGDYLKLLSIEDDKHKLELQIHEIKMKINSKETLSTWKINPADMSERLKVISTLDQKLKNKIVELKELIVDKEKIHERIIGYDRIVGDSVSITKNKIELIYFTKLT